MNYNIDNGRPDNCLTQVCRATSLIYPNENLRLHLAMEMDLPGNLDGNTMHKTMQHLINIEKASGDQLSFLLSTSSSGVAENLLSRTTNGSVSVWGLALNNAYHSLMVFVDRSQSSPVFYLVDQFRFDSYSSPNFESFLQKFSIGYKYNSHESTFTQYKN